MEYLEYNDQSDALQVLEDENTAQGIPVPGGVTQNAFSIITGTNGKYYIKREYVTVEYDESKCTLRDMDIRDVLPPI